MRIPLDYYRILGVPIQASAQQLSQAYHDRALQLPRREYSDLAINTRKQLLDEAYTVLSNAEQRSDYDEHFLSAAPPDPSGATTGPTLDIDPEQFIGALLLLYELGEYELVLHLSEPLLAADAVLVPEQVQLVNNPLTRADIVLAVALSCLELGREQWQQGSSDQAAQMSHYGQDLLLREGLFPGIRGELRADMYKLRPYRILELVTKEESEVELRQKGVGILQDMLAERGGIEGKGDDQSGLNLDDFLRFIQQLRNYLSTIEQQEIFTVEAQRPSAVGTYLLVYAKIAHGFAYSQPQAIAQAQTLLKRLGRHQDVSLEQAVCGLLLGQPEVASQAVEQSQEAESVAFIRENSEGAPDLLPGLCLYSESWLQREVFPHFRDLSGQTLTLKDYFANEIVQANLEKMAGGTNAATSSLSPAAATADTMATDASPYPAITTAPTAPPPTARVEPPMVPVASLEPTNIPSPPPFPPESVARPEESDPVPVARRSRSPQQLKRQRDRLLLLGFAALVAVLGVVFLLSQLIPFVRSLNRSESETAVETDAAEADAIPLAIALSEPPVPIPTGVVGPEPVSTTDEPIDEELAQKIIQTWLDVKALALGPKHQADELNKILAEPLLADWQQRTQEFLTDNVYEDYTHTIDSDTITITTDGNASNRALVEASVREQSTQYRGGQLVEEGASDDNLRVRYELVQQNERWLIRGIKVVEYL